MRRSDLVIATGGQGLVRAAYSSGTPAYGVGAGNATEFVDETADLEETARNCMLSKTSDFGSGCSADGNVLVPRPRSIDDMLDALQSGGRLSRDGRAAAALQAVMWDDEGHRLPDTVAVSPQALAQGRRLRDPRRPQVHHRRGRRHRRGPAVLQGEAHDPDGGPRLRRASRMASSWPSGSTTSAARATPAASPRPTTPTSTTSRGTCPSRGSWCASRTRRPTRARSRTGCR